MKVIVDRKERKTKETTSPKAIPKNKLSRNQFVDGSIEVEYIPAHTGHKLDVS